MKNKWSFFAVTLAVVLCMTVFSVTAYAGGDMVDSTMGDPTMETPTATTQPENTNAGEQTPNGQTLTVLVTENADEKRQGPPCRFFPVISTDLPEKRHLFQFRCCTSPKNPL